MRKGKTAKRERNRFAALRAALEAVSELTARDLGSWWGRHSCLPTGRQECLPHRFETASWSSPSRFPTFPWSPFHSIIEAMSELTARDLGSWWGRHSCLPTGRQECLPPIHVTQDRAKSGSGPCRFYTILRQTLGRTRKRSRDLTTKAQRSPSHTKKKKKRPRIHTDAHG